MNKKKTIQEPINFTFNIKEILNYNSINEKNFYLYVDNLYDFHKKLILYFYSKSINKIDIYKYYVDSEPLVNLLHSEDNIENAYKHEKDVVKIFNERLFKVFEFSHKNDLFYNWCSLKTYKSTIDARYNEYELSFIDTDKLEFMKSEYRNVLYSYSTMDISSFIDSRNIGLLKKSCNQKIEFLNIYFKENKIEVKVHSREPLTYDLFHLDFVEEANLYNNLDDLDDLSDSSVTEKILYLQKLGVLDFLKAKSPFNTSTNKLATILSAITGEKASTIQTMINPIFNSKVDDRNNPLNSQKAMNRVKNKLIQIDFNLNDTI